MEQNEIAWGKDRKCCVGSLWKSCQLIGTEKSGVSVLDEWVHAIRTLIVNSKMCRLQKQNYATTRICHDVNTCLDQLHYKYIFAPADKAANNVIIICKHFHFEYYCKRARLVGFSWIFTYIWKNMCVKLWIYIYNNIDKFKLSFSNKYTIYLQYTQFQSYIKIHINFDS